MEPDLDNELQSTYWEVEQGALKLFKPKGGLRKISVSGKRFSNQPHGY